MKTLMIIFLSAITLFITSCGIDTRTDTEKYLTYDIAIMINDRSLEKATPDIGGIKLVRYLPVSVDAGIADMESRGYKVKQITDTSNVPFQPLAITVMYERVK